MALNNSQYDAIMRDYQRLQSQHRHEQDDRIQEAYGRFPRLSEIHALIASESVACGKALLNGDNQALDRLKLHIQKLGTERASILQKGGYPADYLELTYTCPYCHDTGYIVTRSVSALRRQRLICCIPSRISRVFWKKRIFPLFLITIILMISGMLPVSHLWNVFIV